jgi:hypothetical protein
MKKVRYMIGAAGALALAPALGAVTPAANAATAQGAAGQGGKTVSLNHSTTSAAPFACLAQSVRRKHSGTGVNKFSVTIGGTFDELTPCVGFDSAVLDHRQGGLKLRVRTYLNGVEHGWGLRGGLVSGGTTTFAHSLNAPMNRVCDALVYSTSPTTVAYGPVCISP